MSGCAGKGWRDGSDRLQCSTSLLARGLTEPSCAAGSFGKVYKGRWKGAMVAVKVIEHNKSVASRLEGLRESVLSANIQHPNVVSGLAAPGLPLQSASAGCEGIVRAPAPADVYRGSSRERTMQSSCVLARPARAR